MGILEVNPFFAGVTNPVSSSLIVESIRYRMATSILLVIIPSLLLLCLAVVISVLAWAFWSLRKETKERKRTLKATMVQISKKMAEANNFVGVPNKLQIIETDSEAAMPPQSNFKEAMDEVSNPDDFAELLLQKKVPLKSILKNKPKLVKTTAVRENLLPKIKIATASETENLPKVIVEGAASKIKIPNEKKESSNSSKQLKLVNTVAVKENLMPKNNHKASKETVAVKTENLPTVNVENEKKKSSKSSKRPKPVPADAVRENLQPKTNHKGSKVTVAKIAVKTENLPTVNVENEKKKSSKSSIRPKPVPADAVRENLQPKTNHKGSKVTVAKIAVKTENLPTVNVENEKKKSSKSSKQPKPVKTENLPTVNVDAASLIKTPKKRSKLSKSSKHLPKVDKYEEQETKRRSNSRLIIVETVTENLPKINNEGVIEIENLPPNVDYDTLGAKPKLRKESKESSKKSKCSSTGDELKTSYNTIPRRRSKERDFQPVKQACPILFRTTIPLADLKNNDEQPSSSSSGELKHNTFPRRRLKERDPQPVKQARTILDISLADLKNNDERPSSKLVKTVAVREENLLPKIKETVAIKIATAAAETENLPKVIGEGAASKIKTPNEKKESSNSSKQLKLVKTENLPTVNVENEKKKSSKISKRPKPVAVDAVSENLLPRRRSKERDPQPVKQARAILDIPLADLKKTEERRPSAFSAFFREFKYYTFPPRQKKVKKLVNQDPILDNIIADLKKYDVLERTSDIVLKKKNASILKKARRPEKRPKLNVILEAEEEAQSESDQSLENERLAETVPTSHSKEASNLMFEPAKPFDNSRLI
jgi:hypothetical protein